MHSKENIEINQATKMQQHSPLRGKLNKVKSLLDNESRRLQEEVSQNGIFTTRTSGSPTQVGIKGTCNGEISNVLNKTMTDISIMRSVLSCPIFKRIVNVTNSLDELSHQLNLHPSIGPADISIDSNGELILAPPLQNTNIDNENNILTEVFNENQFSNNSNIHEHKILVDQQNDANRNKHDQTRNLKQTANKHQTAIILNGASNVEPEIVKGKQNHPMIDSQTNVPNFINDNNLKSFKSYDTEKLISNGKPNMPMNDANLLLKNNNQSNPCSRSGQRLYRSDVSQTLDQVSPNEKQNNNVADGSNEHHQTLSHKFDQFNINPLTDGISNEMYSRMHELIQVDMNAIESQSPSSNVQNGSPKRHQLIQPSMLNNQEKTIINNQVNAKNSNVQYVRGSCSPSTSIGSTVRLADECDSGASSYQSQSNNNSNNNNSNKHMTTPTRCPLPVPSYSSRQAPQTLVNLNANCEIVEPRISQQIPSPNNNLERVVQVADSSSSCEQNVKDLLNDNPFEPEAERIKVDLEKDGNGLGIVIAGYKCEQEEIAGIFIKSIAQGSPADKCGKIRVLDQIYAVNGRKLLGFSNPEAVNVLRNTGSRVSLELVRYPDLSINVEHRISHNDTSNQITTTTSTEHTPAVNLFKIKPISCKTENTPDAPASKSQITPNIGIQPINSNQPQNSQDQPMIPSGQQTSIDQEGGSNTIDTPTNNPNLRNEREINKENNNVTIQQLSKNYTPILEQTGANLQFPKYTNDPGQVIIETKQGARNTINIRSPVYRSSSSPESTEASATYVNKMPDVDINYGSSDRSIMDRLHIESPSAFGNLVAQNPEWEESAKIIEIIKDPTEGLGFSVKEYANPKNPSQTIIMITSITEFGVADRDGRLSVGDLLIFVDDKNLKGVNLMETVKALRKTNGPVRLGILKIKRY